MPTTTSTPQKTHSTLRRIFFRWAAKLATTLLLLAASGAVWLYWRSQACLPQLDGTLRLAGLRSPVEVVRDAHGVPHLRAQSLEDLLFAQGYVTAQDRLWQMDMSRRLAKGEQILERSEEHTSELQSRPHLVCRLLLEKKKRCSYTPPRARRASRRRKPSTTMVYEPQDSLLRQLAHVVDLDPTRVSVHIGDVRIVAERL